MRPEAEGGHARLPLLLHVTSHEPSHWPDHQEAGWQSRLTDGVPDTQGKGGGGFSLATPVPCRTCRPRAPGLGPCLPPSLTFQDFPRPFSCGHASSQLPGRAGRGPPHGLRALPCGCREGGETPTSPSMAGVVSPRPYPRTHGCEVTWGGRQGAHGARVLADGLTQQESWIMEGNLSCNPRVFTLEEGGRRTELRDHRV